jgi:uncharacterized protein YjeT (DUF2065 family)
MKILIFLIALAWISAGSFLILYTPETREWYRGIIARVNMRHLAAGPFIVGLILLVGAFSGGQFFAVLFFLGLLALAKGAFLALCPLPKIQALTDWWLDQASERTLRLWGIVVLIIGIALFSYLL